jgi:cholesterol transport system auxiliary component
MSRFHRRALLTASGAFILAACSADPVPVDTYYRLELAAAPQPRQGGPIPGIAEVVPLRGDGVVNGRAILFRRGPAELQPYSYHFWADTPADLVQGQLIDALRNANAFEKIASPEMRLNRDYEILGTLRKLEHNTPQSTAVIELELTVRKVRGNTALWTKVYKAETPTKGDDVSSAVTGFSAALSQIIAEFVADLGQFPAA